MARAHRNVLQAAEIVFFYSSSSLGRFNTSLFILSTTTAYSGIPLAVVATSDKTEATITWKVICFLLRWTRAGSSSGYD